jgi:hypothetical protein
MQIQIYGVAATKRYGNFTTPNSTLHLYYFY